MTTDRISGAVLVIFSILVIWYSTALPVGSFRHPGPAYIPILLAAILLVFGGLIAGTAGHAPDMSSIGWTEGRHAAAILVACIFAGFGLERLGYRVTVALALLFLFKIVERRGWLLSASLSVALAFASFYLFHTLLRVPLPPGPFGF